MSVFEIYDYLNFSSTCICEISIHLLFNSAIINNFKNYPSRREGQDRVVGKGQCFPAILWLQPCYALRKSLETFEEFLKIK